MIRVPYQNMFDEFLRVLLKIGFTPERAQLCAKLFAEASRDGVYTHGLNRFPRFINNIKNGYIKIDASPVKIETSGSLERWDGNHGPGNLNAYFCMNRAIEIAKEHGIGCVALKNTHHWMRPGAYGLQAAEAGCIGICWTNTIPNMPPWGAKEPKLGNNPIVFAVPDEKGHILLDMAVSMFSYGKLESYALHDQMLPVDGGFDGEGNLTRDPKAVIKSHQPLPIGCWKGSGLSLLLDLIAMVLSGGNSALQVGKFEVEMGLSQVFIAFDISGLSGKDYINQSLKETIVDLHNSTPIHEGGRATYPGERMLETRKENLEKGIPVEPVFWQQVLEM